jgi:hypothetical protein
MARTSTYFNCSGNIEADYLFYKSVIGTELSATVTCCKDIPSQPGQSPI